MKILAILLLFAIAGHCTYANHVHHFQSDIVKKHVERIFGGKIKDGLEKFKKVMKTGYTELNIPILDPFDSDYEEISVDEDIIRGEGKFNDIHVEGLSEFTVKNADYEFLKSNVVIDLVWPSVKGNTSYDVNTTVLGEHPVYGAGDVSFEVQNFNFATKMKVSLDLVNKKVSIISFSNTKISLEKLRLEITGLFNNEELSERVSSTISEMAPEILADFHDEITKQFNALMPSLGNKILEQIDIWKFINI